MPWGINSKDSTAIFDSMCNVFLISSYFLHSQNLVVEDPIGFMFEICN